MKHILSSGYNTFTDQQGSTLSTERPEFGQYSPIAPDSLPTSFKPIKSTLEDAASDSGRGGSEEDEHFLFHRKGGEDSSQSKREFPHNCPLGEG